MIVPATGEASLKAIEGGIATMVSKVLAAAGFVPVFVPVANVKLLNESEAMPKVLPTVPDPDTEAVTKIYLVVPAAIVLLNPETLSVEPLATEDKVEPS